MTEVVAVVEGSSASTATVAGGQEVIAGVEMFRVPGPIYTQGEDISDILQQELDAYRRITIPPGHYYVDNPLVTPYRSGGKMFGAGRSDVLISADVALSGLSTRLQYRGEPSNPGEPMITVQGGEFDFYGISFLASTPNASSDPAKLNIPGIRLVSSGGAGLGAGKLDIYGCGFYGWDDGIQLGEDEDDVSCDVNWIRRCSFRNNETCIHSKNVFALETSIDKCQFRFNNTNAVKVSGGGHIQIDDCLVTAPTFFLRMSDENAFQYRTGNNSRNITIGGLKVDSQAHPGFQFVKSDDHNEAWVRFDRPQVSANGGPGTVAFSEGNIDNDMILEINSPSYANALNVTPFTISTL